MKTRKTAAGLLAILAALGGIYRAIVVVDETEYVVVTNFGKIVAVHGAHEGDAGLHWKAPWQEAHLIDKRVRVLDGPPREVITGDKRNLEAAAYLIYRVADPVRFLTGAGGREAAEARLQERLAAALSDVIGRHDLAALASTEKNRFALDEISREVARMAASASRDELGVEILDARLRRYNHPLEVRPAVFELIRGERRQVAARLRAEGEAQYTTITSQADRTRAEILSSAEAEAERTRGKAEAEAARILGKAHEQDPRFYEFLRTLESYRAILDGRTTLVLSASSPLFKLLVEGPPHPPAQDPGSERPIVKNGASAP